MARVKTVRHSVWREGFLFVGNHLALDFLNTRPVQNGKARELLPDFNALLSWFQAASLLSPGEVMRLQGQWKQSARARSVLQVVREFREMLRKEVLAWERGGTVHQTAIDELNRLMAEHPCVPV